MSHPISDEKRVEYEQELEAIEALRQQPMWQEFHKMLRSHLEHHLNQHESAVLTADRRAEHLHAVKELRELVAWLDEKQRMKEAAVRKWHEQHES